MTDDLPELPQFSRNVAVLTEGVPDYESDRSPVDYGVLNPFSGVLDMQIEEGQVPMVELSYLTLEPLVASGLARSAGGNSGSRSAHRGPDVERSMSTAGDAESDGEDDAGEPTVREALHGDRDVRLERQTPDLQRLALEDEGPPRTRPDLGSDRREPRTPTDSTVPAPDRTVLDQSGQPPEDRDRSADHSSGSQTSDSTPSLPAPDQRGSTGSETIVPPRMVTESGTENTGRHSHGRSGRHEPGQSPADEPDDPDTATNGPRMVVDREDESVAVNSESSDGIGAGDTGDVVGRDLHGRTVDVDEQIAAIAEATRDPESPLVDRLYRTLREREAIERRRRGGP